MTQATSKSAMMTGVALLAGVLGCASRTEAASFEYRAVNLGDAQHEALQLDGAPRSGERVFFVIKQAAARKSAASQPVEIVLPRGCHVVETQGAADLTISHDGGRTFAPLSEEPPEALRLPDGGQATHMRWNRTAGFLATRSSEVLVVAEAD